MFNSLGYSMSGCARGDKGAVGIKPPDLCNDRKIHGSAVGFSGWDNFHYLNVDRQLDITAET
jgi:hypothetical protein